MPNIAFQGSRNGGAALAVAPPAERGRYVAKAYSSIHASLLTPRREGLGSAINYCMYAGPSR